MSEGQFNALAEGSEAEFMYQYESMAPQATKASLGIATARIGGGVVLSMRHDVTGYWSKALGFGSAEPVTPELIGRVLEFYRAHSSPGAVIQIAPSMLPSEWDEICVHYGIAPDWPWTKLVCQVNDFQPRQSALRVGPVGRDDAREWASVALRGFGMPEGGLADLLVASVENPNFRPFAAWAGAEMVAAANLFIHGEVGSLNSDATLQTHRNQGAQSALLAARAKEAASTGCRWLVAETAKPAKGAVNPSLNNMLRSGLRPQYDRPNWIWRPDRNRDNTDQST